MAADYFGDSAFTPDGTQGDSGDEEDNATKAAGMMRKVLPIVILLVFALLGWYLYQTLPRDSTLRVSLSELDSGSGVVADIEVQLNGKTVRTGTTNEEGNALITRVPGNTDLTVRITPARATFSPFSRPVKITNGESATVTASVARDADIEIGDVTPALQALGMGCTNSYSVPVTNHGKSTTKVELLFAVTGDVVPVVTTTAVDVAPDATENIPFKITAPRTDDRRATRIEGTLRPKYITGGKKVTLSLGEAPILDVAPTGYRCNAGSNCKFTVSLHNRGVSPITDVKAEAQGEIAPNILLDEASYSEGRAIGPDETYNFFVTIDKSNSVGQLGKLVITSSCPPPREIILYGPEQNG